MKNYLTLFIAATMLCGCYKRNLEPTVSGSSIISIIPKHYDFLRGMVADKHGNIFISHSNIIEKVDNIGKSTIIAGGGKLINYDDRPATDANFFANGLTIDANDNLYFTQWERNRIVKIDPQGIAHIIAGLKIQDSFKLPKSGFSGDGGPANDALMSSPSQIAVDGNGNVYFNDGINYRIRKINAQGIISTVIGGGTNDPMKGGMAVNANRTFSWGMVVDNENNLYTTYNGTGIIKITPDGILSTIAGSNDTGSTPDGKKAMGSKFGYITGLALGANGHLYFSEINKHLVRMIDGLGLLHTVAGIGKNYSVLEGIGGPAIKAAIDRPSELCFDSYGNLYIASVRTWYIYKVNR